MAAGAPVLAEADMVAEAAINSALPDTITLL